MLLMLKSVLKQRGNFSILHPEPIVGNPEVRAEQRVAQEV